MRHIYIPDTVALHLESPLTFSECMHRLLHNVFVYYTSDGCP